MLGDDRLRRVHERDELLGRGPDREHGRLPGEVVGRYALGIAEIPRNDAQMAVLHTGIEANTVTPAPELGVERRDDGRALLTRRMTGGEVDHRRRYGVVQRDQVATECDVVGAELDAHRRRLDGSAPGMEARRVVPEDRHVADVATGRT